MNSKKFNLSNRCTNHVEILKELAVVKLDNVITTNRLENALIVIKMFAANVVANTNA